MTLVVAGVAAAAIFLIAIGIATSGSGSGVSARLERYASARQSGKPESGQGGIADLLAQSVALAQLNKVVEQRDFGANLARDIARADLKLKPSEFLAISGNIGIVPTPAIYVLVVSLALWLVFEFLPLGRYLYVLGASPRAAELNGISAKRYVTLGFVAAGTLAAFAGVVLQSQLQVGQSSVGQEYLLPAFTAALLGATSIRPGRVNVWGTVLAVAVLAVTVAGLNQLGAPFFVEPLFNGAMLILAVGLAVQAAQRRTKRGTEADRAASTEAAAQVGE